MPMITDGNIDWTDEEKAKQEPGLRYAIHCYVVSDSGGMNLCMVGRNWPHPPTVEDAREGLRRAVEILNEKAHATDARPMTGEEIGMMQQVEDMATQRGFEGMAPEEDNIGQVLSQILRNKPQLLN